MRQLMEYDWPGNVRELMHVIERAAILTRSPVVQVEDLMSRSTLREEAPSGRRRSAGARTLEDVERTHILAALEQASWVIEGSKGAAQVLGLHPNTLRYRLKKLGIQRPA